MPAAEPPGGRHRAAGDRRAFSDRHAVVVRTPTDGRHAASGIRGYARKRAVDGTPVRGSRLT